MPQASQIDGKVVDKQLKLEENRVRKIEIFTFFKQSGEIVCEGEPKIKVGLIGSSTLVYISSLPCKFPR